METLDLTTTKWFILLLPLIALQLTLIIVALYQLKQNKVHYLSKPIWLCIILFVTALGPILFLFIGRQTDDHS